MLSLAAVLVDIESSIRAACIGEHIRVGGWGVGCWETAFCLSYSLAELFSRDVREVPEPT